MTEKRKEMFERTVENLKKLDKESLAIVKARSRFWLHVSRWMRTLQRMLHNRQADTNRLRREEGTLWKNIR